MGIAKTGEIYRFGDAVRPIGPQPVRVIEQTTRSKPLSVWQEMFGKDAFIEDLQPAKETVPPVQSRKIGRPSDVFEGPSHTMPPVGLLFDAFMEELLAAKSGDEKKDVASPADGIQYEEATVAPPQPLLAVEETRTRPVTDEEVRDLEVFFCKILQTSTWYSYVPPVPS